MAGANVLVVFHSRTGNTRRMARAIAESLGADMEEIADLKKRTGLLGYLSAARDALRRRLTPIGEGSKDPADYGLVIVGTPVWVGRMSSPVRSYLDRSRGRFQAVGFFCTCGGRNDEAALFAEMSAVAGCAPRAVLAITAGQATKGGAREKVRAFEESVAGATPDDRSARRTA